MNRLKRMITSSMAVLLAAGMTLNYSACSKDSPMSPTVDTDQQSEFQILAKKGGQGKGKFEQSSTTLDSSSTNTDLAESSSTSLTGDKGNKSNKGSKDSSDAFSTANYPQSGSITLSWSMELRGYTGGNIQLEKNGSKFHINEGSFTPPPGTGAHKDVTLNMLVEMNEKNELIYTFGPSGSRFDHPAKIWLSWSDLGKSKSAKVPNFFYIDENGNYVKQQADDIDIKGKHLILYVDHFSRYAVAWAN